MQRGLSSFVWGSYHDVKAVGIVRYRVEMAVSDASDSALFVAFDAEMNKLNNVPAAWVSHGMGAGMEDAHSISLPQCLRDILGTALNIPSETFKSREVMTTPAIIFQELYIKILLKLFKEVLLSTTVDPLLMSWWKTTQEQPLNLPKTMFAMVMLQIIWPNGMLQTFTAAFCQFLKKN